MQTRLMGQYNGKWPISLVYELKPLNRSYYSFAFMLIIFISLLRKNKIQKNFALKWG